MGTRSLTIVKDSDGQDLVTLYRQYDGYPTGLGSEIFEQFKEYKIINGLPSGKDHPKIANGMGCLAAQLVAHFCKALPGNYHLCPTKTRGVGEEFVYVLSLDEIPSDDSWGKGTGTLNLRIFNGPITAFGSGGEDCTNLIYDGPLDAFNPAKVESAIT